MKRDNMKGFTLVELLAVIIILAILVLVALPNVTGMMNNARKNAFKTDVFSMATNGAQNAFVYAGLNNKAITRISTSTTKANAQLSNTMYKLSDGDYMCITLTDLVANGYVEKGNVATNASSPAAGQYRGYIQVFADKTGKTQMYINVSNGSSYTMKGLYSTLSNTQDIDTVVTTGTSNPLCPLVCTLGTDGTKCGSATPLAWSAVQGKVAS